MFNESLKNKFINSTRKGNDVSSLFVSSQPYEEKYGKDLCQFSQDELQDFVNHCLGVMESTKRSRLMLVRQYIKWCSDNGIPNVSEVIGEITTNDTSRIKETMVSSPEHLNSVMDTVFRKVDEHTIDNVYRCFLWMAFAGIPQCDVMKITSANVDFKEMEIVYNGNSFPIYKEAVSVIRDCAELEQFIYDHREYNNPVWRARADGKALLRGYIPDAAASSVASLIRKAIVNARARCGETIPKLNYSHVAFSGQFYRMRERESIGFPIDFRWYIANEWIADGSYDPDDPKIMNRLKVKAHRLKMDYECWKSAF